MSYIEVKHLNKDLQRKSADGSLEAVHVFSDVTFDIEKGEFICLLGFSGCGKLTILNILAGFRKADQRQRAHRREGSGKTVAQEHRPSSRTTDCSRGKVC